LIGTVSENVSVGQSEREIVSGNGGDERKMM